MTTTLPDTDLHAMYTLLEDARRDAPGEVVPWALLDGLTRLIGTESVQLSEMDWVHECLVQQQAIFEGERYACTDVVKDDVIVNYFRASRDFRACADPELAGETGRATRFSDFYSDREFLNTQAWVEHYSVEDPVRACLGVRLPSPPGHARRVLFMRSTFTHFTDRDVMLLTLLRPHLHEIYLDAERRRTGPPKLTAREWQILQLAGEGLPNAAIGHKLFISAATVRKHMEHIFDTLAIHNRAEAAAAALPHRPTVTSGSAPLS